MKKKLYFSLLLLNEDVEVKEHGAAVVYIDTENKEQTLQVPMFMLTGTPQEIVSQLSDKLAMGFTILESKD